MAPVQGRWAPGRREASSFLSEHGLPRAGSARSAAWRPRHGPRVGIPHNAGLSPAASQHPDALGVLCCQPRCGFLTSEPPPKLRNAPGYRHHPSTMGTPGPPGKCGASEGSVPPPSPPACPAQGSIKQQSVPRASGAGAWAALPSQPSCRGNLPRGWSWSLSPKRGSSANALCQGSSGQRLPWRGTPSHRHSPAPWAGSSRGLPCLGNVGAFWADWSLSGHSKAPQPLHQLPSFLPEGGFLREGGCSESTSQN